MGFKNVKSHIKVALLARQTKTFLHCLKRSTRKTTNFTHLCFWHFDGCKLQHTSECSLPWDLCFHFLCLNLKWSSGRNLIFLSGGVLNVNVWSELQNSCPDKRLGQWVVSVQSRLSSRALYTMTGRLEKRFCTALCLAGSAAIHNECVTALCYLLCQLLCMIFPPFLTRK